MSSEHFTVDGTLIESWASLSSFKKKDDDESPPDDPGNPTVDFHGEKRANETRESTTDPDAKLARRVGGKRRSSRKRIEEVFRWLKTVGNFRKTRYIGLGANQVAAYVLASAYNLLRIAKLLEAA